MEGPSHLKRQSSAERQSSIGDNRPHKRRKINEKKFPSKEELLSGIKNPSLEVILSQELTEVESNLQPFAEILNSDRERTNDRGEGSSILKTAIEKGSATDDSFQSLQERQEVLMGALLIIGRVTSTNEEKQEQGMQDLQDCLSKKDDFHQKVLTKIIHTLDKIRPEEVYQLQSDIITKPSLESYLSRELLQVDTDLDEGPATDDSFRKLEKRQSVLARAILITKGVTSKDQEEQEQGMQDLQDCLSKEKEFYQNVITTIRETLDKISREDIALPPSDVGRPGTDPSTRASQPPDVVQRSQASDEGREKPSLRRKLADQKKVHEEMNLDLQTRSEQRWDLLASHLGPSLRIRLANLKKVHEERNLDLQTRSEQRWDLLASHLGPSLQRKLADQKKVHEAGDLDLKTRSEQRWDLLASHLEAVGGGEKDDRFDSQIDDIDPGLLKDLSQYNLNNTNLPLSKEIRENAKIVRDYQRGKKTEAQQVCSYEQASQALRNLKSATKLLYDYSQAGDNSTLKKAVDAFKSLDDRYDTVPQADLDQNPRMRINHAILHRLDMSTTKRMDEQQAVLSSLNMNQPAREPFLNVVRSINTIKDYFESKNAFTEISAIRATGDYIASIRLLRRLYHNDKIRNINAFLDSIESDYYDSHPVPQADLDQDFRMRLNHAILHRLDMSTIKRQNEQAILSRPNVGEPLQNFVRSSNILRDYIEHQNGITEIDAIRATGSYVDSIQVLNTLHSNPLLTEINAVLDSIKSDYYASHAVTQADLDQNPSMKKNHAILRSLTTSNFEYQDEQAILSSLNEDEPAREPLQNFIRSNNRLKDYVERKNGFTEKDAIMATDDYISSARVLRTLYPVDQIIKLNDALDKLERNYNAEEQ